MNFSNSRDESLLSLWESVQRQVSANRANGGRSRFVGDNFRAYAESLCSEMDRRQLTYAHINWSEQDNKNAGLSEAYGKAPR